MRPRVLPARGESGAGAPGVRGPPPPLAIVALARSYRAGVRGCDATVRVLSGATLIVRAGETVAVVGAPGSGKTTLLLCAAGLLRADAGSVRWFGADDLACARELVALAAAPLPPSPHLTIGEAIALASGAGAWACGESDTLARRLGLHALRALPLAEVGEEGRWRAALAIAFGRRPRILLLDEPPAHDGRAAVVAPLVREYAASGNAILVAARGTGGVAGSCQRLVRLARGAIEPGPPCEAGAMAHVAEPRRRPDRSRA